MFDYENLRLFTWAVIGVLLIGFIITDGFDMGVAALLPVLGKSEVDRRIMINSIAPHWDGNQVWLVTAGDRGWRDLRDMAGNLRGCVLRVLFSHDYRVGDPVVKTTRYGLPS